MYEDDTDFAYLFVCASISPLRAYFQILRHVMPLVPDIRGLGFHQQNKALQCIHRFHFVAMQASFCTDKHFLKWSDKPMWVLPSVSWGLDGQLFADAEPMPFELYTSRWPKPVQFLFGQKLRASTSFSVPSSIFATCSCFRKSLFPATPFLFFCLNLF